MAKMSGPRQRNGRFYSKQRRGRPAGRRNSSGLNKTEVRQTKQIAERMILSKAESKYFDCASIAALSNDGVNTSNIGQILVPSGTFGGSQNYRVMVKGYATTNIQKGDTSVEKYTYGSNVLIQEEMINLQMTRRDVDATTSSYTMEGKYATPSLSTLEMFITRVAEANPPNDEMLLRDKSPIKFRVIMASPRTSTSKNSNYTQEIDPCKDLFLTEKGVATGVDDTLSVYQMELLKTNGRKYKIGMDKTFTLNCPNSYVTSTGVQQIGNGVSNKMVKFKFDLGKEVFYKEVSNRLATAGSTNQFVLIHAWFPCLGNLDNSNLDMTDVRLSSKAISTFKDL